LRKLKKAKIEKRGDMAKRKLEIEKNRTKP